MLPLSTAFMYINSWCELGAQHLMNQSGCAPRFAWGVRRLGSGSLGGLLPRRAARTTRETAAEQDGSLREGPPALLAECAR